MASAVKPSSLADRALIIKLMERTAAACAKCVLQTVASVCGAGCVKERLHILTDFEVQPLPCLPELAARLAHGEAEGLSHAVAAGEPIGVVLPAASSHLTDLYVPVGGAGRYQGTDGGAFAHTCDEAVHGPLLAISPTSPADATACDGELWIDLRTGRARSERVASGGESAPTVPVDFELGWAGCSAHLPMDAPPAEASTKLFAGAESGAYIACWLRRFYGRQASLPGPGGQPSFAVEFPDGVAVTLLADVSVRSGSTLRISSGGAAKLVVGVHQLRVASGALLELARLVVADSERSSAVVAEGTLTASDCTFLRCATTTNAVAALPERYVPDGVGAFISAGGGAVFSLGATTMEGCAFLECSASGAKLGAFGGALYVGHGSHATLRRTTLRYNAASGGSFAAMGGAIYVDTGSQLTLVGSRMSENTVTGGEGASQGALGGALAFSVGARGSLADTEMCNNTAHGPSSDARGGAIIVTIGSSLFISGSSFRGNVVRCSWSRGVGSGGAICAFGPGGTVTVAASEFADNTLQGEGAYSAVGGAMAAFGGTLTVEAATFVRNRVHGDGVQTAAGAVFVDELSTAALHSCQLVESGVRGAYARGGAVVSKGTLRLSNSTLGRNRVSVTKDVALGGALHVAGGTAHLVGCRLHHNIAESLLSSILASSGAVSSEGAGDVLIEDSRFWGNAIGGKGASQPEFQSTVPLHVGNSGKSMKLDRCEIFDADDGEAEPVLDNPGVVWLGATTSLVLQDSRFRSSTAGQVLLGNAASDAMSQVLIRSCRFENVVIAADGAHRPLGIVGSTFESAGLGESVPTVPPPQCAVQLAGERMCDERAVCEGVSGGGVRCACEGPGLRYKPGVPADGRRCEQDASLRAVLESDSAVIAVDKPGNLTGRALTLIVEARGEAELNTTFRVSMTRLEASSGAVIATNGSIRVDQPTMSAFGQHIEWTQRPPEPTWLADLDGNRLKFSAASRHAFTVRLACERDEPTCAADGDVITTVVQLASPQDGRVKAQEVTVQTRVVALASCGRSVAIAMQSVGSSTRALPVKASLLANAAHVFVDLDVVDADGIPIRVSVPNAAVLWGSGEGPSRQIVPTKAAQGGTQSNRFTASIDASLRSAPGLYRLQVVLRDAWNEAGGAVGACVLLEQTVRVDGPEEGFNTAYLLLGCAIGAGVLIMALVLVARKYRDRFKHIFGTVIVEVVKLTFSWAFEGGDIATDGVSFHRTVISNEIKDGYMLPSRYKIAYIVAMCLASAAAVISTAYRVKVTRDLFQSIRRQQSDASRSDADDSHGADAMKSKLRWEVAKTRRDLIGIVLHALTCVCEDIPFIVLNCLLIFSEGVTDPWMLGSTLISVLMLGNKLQSVLASSIRNFPQAFPQKGTQSMCRSTRYSVVELLHGAASAVADVGNATESQSSCNNAQPGGAQPGDAHPDDAEPDNTYYNSGPHEAQPHDSITYI